jgi:hypothetical protein
MRSLGFGGVAIVFLLCGCPRSSPELSRPISLRVALLGLENDLRDATLVSMQDAISTDAVRKAKFEAEMRQEQCFYQTPDPSVPILVPPVSLALQGTFTSTGQFQVTATGPAPGGSLGGSVAQAESQLVTLPMNFSILSHMPDVYMGQNLTYLSGLPDSVAYINDPTRGASFDCSTLSPTAIISNQDTKKLLACNKTAIPNAEKTKLVKTIEANRESLQKEVEQLIISYDPKNCPPESKSSGGVIINNFQ